MTNSAQVYLVWALLGACCTLGVAADPEPAAPERTVPEYFTESIDAYHAGDFQRSLEAANASLRILQTQSAMAHNNVCSAEMRLGHYQPAIDACRRALELAPGFERARNNLAWIYESQAASDPTVGTYLNLSELRYWQGDLDGSIAASEHALALEPDSVVAHNNLCAAHAKGKNWKKAERECEKALALNPDYDLAQNNLAWARSRTAPSVD